jgi:farnesyl diphosphate synthase
MKPLDTLISKQSHLYNERVNLTLDTFLKTLDKSATSLHQAIQYTCLNGGKRLRALLVYAVGETFGVQSYQLDNAAAAVELIHSYSLIHDDLPAMDNANLRRGKPACHKAFNEAIAILAGDAQQALAFHLLTKQTCLSDKQTLKMIQVLSEAALDMVTGQALDITANLEKTDLLALNKIHLGKTAALIKASILLGALPSNPSQDSLDLLSEYGKHLGLAYQIHDDILDVEGSAEILGKPAQADEAKDKVTYPAICGLDIAKETAKNHFNQAMQHLSKLPIQSDFLNRLSALMINRAY